MFLKIILFALLRCNGLGISWLPVLNKLNDIQCDYNFALNLFEISIHTDNISKADLSSGLNETEIVEFYYYLLAQSLTTTLGETIGPIIFLNYINGDNRLIYVTTSNKTTLISKSNDFIVKALLLQHVANINKLPIQRSHYDLIVANRTFICPISQTGFRHYISSYKKNKNDSTIDPIINWIDHCQKIKFKEIIN